LENFSKIKALDRIKGGKSEAFLFSTNDGKFVIKTIGYSEKKNLCKDLVKKYLLRLKTCEMSKLVRIYGVFKLLPEKQYFILMENIIKYPENALIFDLKGSYDGRYVEVSDEIPFGVTLKDVNFRKSGKRIEIELNDYKIIKKILKQDLKILMDCNIMDYSILVAFYDHNQRVEDGKNRYLIQSSQGPCVLGIIDILQKYNHVKKSERVIKTALFRRTVRMSSIPANLYYERIYSFLKEIFYCDDSIHLLNIPKM
jgi:hypothetical protein